jgi:hypothetical protein
VVLGWAARFYAAWNGDGLVRAGTVKLRGGEEEAFVVLQI